MNGHLPSGTRADSPPRVAFLVCDYPLGTATLVLNCIALLCERGVAVDVIADGGSLATPMELPKNARIIRPRETFRDKVARKLMTWKAANRFFPDRRLAAIARISPYWASFARCMRSVVARERYAHVVCVSYPALFAYDWHAFADSVTYCNMELLDDTPDAENLYQNKQLCRELERKALARVSRVIAMSADRAALFGKMTGYPAERIAILPIVPRRGEAVPKGNYFRERFGIPDDMRIVVYSGGIGDWALLREIAATVPRWPEKHALVIHTWRGESLDSAYGKQLREAVRGMPVYFSRANFSRPELLRALASADVGVAYYKALDGNFTNILFSSNKMCEYLLAGLPILCSPFPALKEGVEHRCLGKAVPVDAIPQALREIARTEEAIHASIRDALRNELVFDTYFTVAFPEFYGASVRSCVRQAFHPFQFFC